MISLSVPGFDSVELFALKVLGRSMDEFYADGSYVVCASPVDMGLADGDHVAVRHYDGAFAETTLKEVAIERDGAVTLIPRTTDPTLRTALSYQRGDDLNQTGIEIIGIVVASYNLRARGRRVA
jgi:phage repressor protein C with HTH and peptisase S24 domain